MYPWKCCAKKTLSGELAWPWSRPPAALGAVAVLGGGQWITRARGSPARYLEMLLEYLQDYTDRVKPLLDQNELFGKIQTEFEKKWENGTFPGWPVSS